MPALAPAAVHFATATLEPAPGIVNITGITRPTQRAQLAARVMGTIEEMPVTLGQPVHAGDLLVKLGAGELSARVVQAQSQLNAARRDLDRERDLLAKGASTADMVRGLEDRFAAAQATVLEAETMFGYTRVCAPFAGVIARKLANVGDLASPGVPLLELEGTTDFQVEAGVPDSLAHRLVPGESLVIEVPAVRAAFTGKLAELSSAADSNAHTILVKINVPAGAPVRSGQYVRVQVPSAKGASLTIPTAAVSTVGQMERVFVADASGAGISAGNHPSVGRDVMHRAALRLVKTGIVHEDRIEILSGLDEGEHVVVGPPAGLREGQVLEALP